MKILPEFTRVMSVRDQTRNVPMCLRTSNFQSIAMLYVFEDNEASNDKQRQELCSVMSDIEAMSRRRIVTICVQLMDV